MSTLDEPTKKYVLILGGSSGIGLALSEKVAAKGLVPIIISRTPPIISTINYLHYSYDLALANDSLPQIISQIYHQHPFSAVCYSSSSHFPQRSIIEYGSEDFHKSIQVSTVGLHYVLKSLCAIEGGYFRVTVLSSKSSDKVSKYSGMMYSISKSCQKTICRYYSEKFLKEGIGVINLLSPDLVRTPMTYQILGEKITNQPTLAAETVATLIDYLMSEDCPLNFENINLNANSISF